MRWLVPLLLVACGSTPTPAAPAPNATAELLPEHDDAAVPITGAWRDLGTVGDALHPPRRLRAWVPEHDPDTTLPSVLVLDGDGAEAFFALPTTLAQLAGEERVRPFVILALSSTEARDDELSRADGRFVDFLVESVLPHARAALPLSVAREDSAILGYSYGGLQAAAAVVRHPEIFGRAVVQSPSLWVEDRSLTASFRRGSGTLPVRMWIDVGTEEPDPEQLVRYMIRDARAFRDAAIARGMIWGRDLGYLEALGEHHDMRAAGRRMREALLFALSDDDLTELTPTSLAIARHAHVGGRTTFSIEVGYEGGARLTVPRQLAEVFVNGAPLRGEVASVGRRLTVRSHGLEARCE
jgi:predicted alpha/beta superfamily hydrolase